MNKKAPIHLWHPIQTQICSLYLWACFLLLNKYLKEQEYHHPQSWLFFKRETTLEQKQETEHTLSTLLLFFIFFSVHLSKSAQVSSVTPSCPTLCDPMDCSTPDFSVHHQLLGLFKLMFIELVMPSNHLILCRPLFLLLSIFPSIRVFSNESILWIRWPKDWSIP